MSVSDLSRWASDERTKIARTMRMKQGPMALTVLEIRDWKTYGVGGRTWNNIYARASNRASDAHGKILSGAVSPNKGISEAAIRGARSLRGAGAAFVVIGIGVSANTIISAPPEARLGVAKDEAVYVGSGMLGAEAGVGLCLAFGIATGGWGLLACAVVGGGTGGLIADRFVRPNRPQDVIQRMQRDGWIEEHHLR